MKGLEVYFEGLRSCHQIILFSTVSWRMSLLRQAFGPARGKTFETLPLLSFSKHKFQDPKYYEMLGTMVDGQCKKMSDTGLNADTGSMGYRIVCVLEKLSYVVLCFLCKTQTIHQIDQFACLEPSSEIKYIPFFLKGSFTGA